MNRQACQNKHPSNMNQAFPSPSPVPSCSLSRTLTPLAEHFPFSLKETISIDDVNESCSAFWLQFALFCKTMTQTAKNFFLTIRFLSRKQPLEHYSLHYFARGEGKNLTLRPSQESNSLTIIFCVILCVAKKEFWYLGSSQAATHWKLNFAVFCA